MRNTGTIGLLALAAAVVVAGCDDPENPLEAFTLEEAFVRFEDPAATGGPGDIVPAVVQMTTPLEEDVTVELSFAGDAGFDSDFQIVDSDGNVRTDATAGGLTITLEATAADPTPQDTVHVEILSTATDGRTLEITITSAQSASGGIVETGFIESFQSFDLSIDVPAPAGSGVAGG